MMKSSDKVHHIGRVGLSEFAVAMTVTRVDTCGKHSVISRSRLEGLF